MIDLLRKWFSPGATLSTEDLHATVKLVVKIAVGLFLIVLALGAWVVWSSHRPTAVGDQAPDAIVRLVISLAVWCVCVLVAYATIQAWDNSSRAAELVHPAKDEPVVQAAKVLASCLIDAAILLAAALVFGRVVGL